jgi:hypothetical protein
VGRYTTRDPIGYGDGFNVYVYVHNNPINFMDPLGLGPDDEKERKKQETDPEGGVMYWIAENLMRPVAEGIGSAMNWIWETTPEAAEATAETAPHLWPAYKETVASGEQNGHLEGAWSRYTWAEQSYLGGSPRGFAMGQENDWTAAVTVNAGTAAVALYTGQWSGFSSADLLQAELWGAGTELVKQRLTTGQLDPAAALDAGAAGTFGSALSAGIFGTESGQMTGAKGALKGAVSNTAATVVSQIRAREFDPLGLAASVGGGALGGYTGGRIEARGASEIVSNTAGNAVTVTIDIATGVVRYGF